jgi:hypothetical protein
MAQISKRKNNFEMKLSIMKVGFGVFGFLMLIISCSEQEQVEPDLGMDYFPLQVGNYSIYDVLETTILPSSEENSISYELKLTVTDSVVNEKGEVTYIMVREKRISPSASWQSVETWSATVINNRVVQNESNVSFVKLIFPPSLNLSWDGNQYNDLPYNGGIESFYDGSDTPYFISEMDQPITLSTGFTAETSLTVVQNDYNDVITGIDERKEVYAKGVGLVYKEINQFINCNGTICTGDRSFVFIQSLKMHGRI